MKKLSIVTSVFTLLIFEVNAAAEYCMTDAKAREYLAANASGTAVINTEQERLRRQAEEEENLKKKKKIRVFKAVESFLDSNEEYAEFIVEQDFEKHAQEIKKFVCELLASFIDREYFSSGRLIKLDDLNIHIARMFGSDIGSIIELCNIKMDEYPNLRTGDILDRIFSVHEEIFHLAEGRQYESILLAVAGNKDRYERLFTESKLSQHSFSYSYQPSHNLYY